MAKADQPEPRGQERQRRLGGGRRQASRSRAQDPRATDPTARRPATPACPADVKEGFVHGERGGEHRRQRHDGAGPGATRPARNDAAAPAREHGPDVERRAPRADGTPPISITGVPARRSADARPPSAATASASVVPNGSGTASGVSGSGANAHAAEEDAPRERDGGQEGRLMMPVARRPPRRYSARGGIRRNSASASAMLAAAPLSSACLTKPVQRVGGGECGHGGLTIRCGRRRGGPRPARCASACRRDSGRCRLDPGGTGGRAKSRQDERDVPGARDHRVIAIGLALPGAAGMDVHVGDDASGRAACRCPTASPKYRPSKRTMPVSRRAGSRSS